VSSGGTRKRAVQPQSWLCHFQKNGAKRLADKNVIIVISVLLLTVLYSVLNCELLNK